MKQTKLFISVNVNIHIIYWYLFGILYSHMVTNPIFNTQTQGDSRMFNGTIHKGFLLLILLFSAAVAVISAAQNVNAKDATPLVNLDQALQTSGLTQQGTNPIKPLKNINGVVLLANSEGDLVGHITGETEGTATLKLLGLNPQLISIAR